MEISVEWIIGCSLGFEWYQEDEDNYFIFDLFLLRVVLHKGE